MQNIIDKESLAAVDKIIFFPSSWRFVLYVGIQEMQFPEGSSYTCNLGTKSFDQMTHNLLFSNRNPCCEIVGFCFIYRGIITT